MGGPWRASRRTPGNGWRNFRPTGGPRATAPNRCGGSSSPRAGGQRPRGIPSIRDRIVQQARRPILEPLFAGKFSQHRHGFRPEKGGAPALSGVDPAIQGGYQWGVDADRQAFFDTVDHEKWLAALNEEIAEGSVLRRVRQILKAGVVWPATATVEPPELGPPQGGPRSPWLANVDWHQFDLRRVQAGYGLVR